MQKQHKTASLFIRTTSAQPNLTLEVKRVYLQDTFLKLLKMLLKGQIIFTCVGSFTSNIARTNLPHIFSFNYTVTQKLTQTKSKMYKIAGLCKTNLTHSQEY